MDVQTMSMDTRIAAIHYKDYRKKVRAHREKRIADARAKITEGNRVRRGAYSQISLIEKEDTILMASYREMAKGNRLINVESALRTAGLDKQQCPKLAMARASWKECFFIARYNHQGCQFNERQWTENVDKDGFSKNGAFTVPQPTFGFNVSNAEWRKTNNHPALPLKAIVPAIPLHLRPDGDLSEYYILWEAEWKYVPPVDPILLKHVAGYIYSVLAQWDLTPIERAVLEGRIA
jgi:hypothetical protein